MSDFSMPLDRAALDDLSNVAHALIGVGRHAIDTGCGEHHAGIVLDCKIKGVEPLKRYGVE